MINDFFEQSLFSGVVLSLAAFFLGSFLRKKTGLGIFNPLLVSVAVSIVVLLVGKIDYETYNASAKYLSYLLTPATVCLAIPLYEQLPMLKKNLKAIAAGLISGTLTSLAVGLALSAVFGLSHEMYVTLMPKSITTAIGIGLSEELGGYVNITVAVIVVTGVSGNIFGNLICKLFRIKEPIAKGLAFGASAHAIGTAKAMELGETEGAASSLAIAVSGILTVILAQVFAPLL